MLGIFGRKRREQEFASTMMKALAEGQSRAQVNRATGTIGAQFESDPDNNHYCMNAVAALVPIVMRDAGCDMADLSKPDIFNGSIFAFTFSSHLSRLIGAQFEIISTAVLIPLFYRPVKKHGAELSELMPYVIDMFNKLSTHGQVVTDIGQRFADWVTTPSPENYERMVHSYRVFSDANSSRNKG